MLRQCVKVAILAFLAPLAVFAEQEQEFNSKAEYLRWLRDPVDGGWLPNLTGLPNQEEVDKITQHVTDVMSQETEKRCTAIPKNLRLMIFEHYVIYQKMLNAQNIYFDKNTARRWAHVLAMILKESSGDAANISDMKGHSQSTYKSKATLNQWKSILNLTKSTRIKMDYQTNFGLTQTSVDRLFYGFRLAQDQAYHTIYLIGKEGHATPRKVRLNAAIAIRRAIWFYQDFAQGRLEQSDERIHKRDLQKPEFMARYKSALKMVLTYCGTGYMYNSEAAEEEETPGLLKAVDSIAYCKLGSAKKGYGYESLNEKCFAQWVTLCPALNIDIALLTPLSYFETRNEKPVCEGTFLKLLNKKPASQ